MNGQTTGNRLLDRFLGHKVDVLASEVVAFSWDMPPRRGTILLVDRQRCRVTRSRITWDGPEFTIHSLRVKGAPK